MINKPMYSAEVIDGVMMIIDHHDPDNPAPTVTNSIGEVLQDLKAVGELPSIVIYRDTTGTWDGIDHDDGIFTGFYPIRMINRYKAIEFAKDRADR